MRIKMQVQTFFSVCLIGLSACGPSSQLNAPYRAQVLTQLPKAAGALPSDPPVYKIQTVTFNGLEDLDTLTHRYFNTYFGGILSYQPLTAEKAQLVAKGLSVPKLHYSIKDGVIIPRNDDTLFALSTVYQLDVILSRLEEFSGIDPNLLFENGRKFFLFHHSRLMNPELNINGNAFYLGNAIATLRPSKVQNLTESGNLDVLAHEFGHLVFMEYLFPKLLQLKSLKQPEVKKAFQGLNEGFADTFAYALTGNSNAINGIYPFPEFTNGRNFSQIRFNISTMESECLHSYYCIGTLFNNAFFRSETDLGFNPSSDYDRHRGLKLLIQSMKQSESDISTALQNANNRNSALKAFINPVVNHLEDDHFREKMKAHLSTNFPGVL